LTSNHGSRLGAICFIPAGNEHEAARFRDRRSSAHAQYDIDVCFDEIVAPSSSFVGAFRAAQGGE
jgi:hypothetical protein